MVVHVETYSVGLVEYQIKLYDDGTVQAYLDGVWVTGGLTVDEVKNDLHKESNY